MPSIKDFIDMMSTSWPVALGLLLASSGVVLADIYSVAYIEALPSWLPGGAFVLGICSGSVLLVTIFRSALELAAAPFKRKKRNAIRAKHVEGLNNISDPEQWILAWAFANRTQVISADYFNETIKALITKGYLVVPAGQHLPNKMPLRVPDHIWEAISSELQNEDLSHLVGVRPFDRW